MKQAHKSLVLLNLLCFLAFKKILKVLYTCMDLNKQLPINNAKNMTVYQCIIVILLYIVYNAACFKSSIKGDV